MDLDDRAPDERALLDITEVARRTGVAPSALRYYERLGLLEPAGRRGQRRTYAPSAIDRIALILNARATGFSLTELAEVLAGDPERARARVAGKIQELDDRMAALRQVRDRLAHALTCPSDAILECAEFQAGLRELLPE
ncbi:MerR family transcriptional regulator [Streptomyces sp. NPDC046887]|uniref:MerR family transcriptional regulator n=1 Tax=Streptomyces sp. NPDC046887 TaxID=3155472 RepID=UPI0033FFE642